MTVTRYTVEEKVMGKWWPLETRVTLHAARAVAARYYTHTTRIRRVTTISETVKKHEVR